MRAVCALGVAASAVQVTPLQKVVEMLEGMLAKSKDEKHEEVVRFNTFKQWCDDTNNAKRATVKDEKHSISKLTASIEKDTATIAHLDDELARLNDDLAAWQGDLKAAAGIRKKENIDFMEQHKDYTTSIDQLNQAVESIKSHSHDAPQSSALLQLQNNKLIPTSAYRVLQAFLQSGDDGVPEANAYESQSGGVVEVLTELRRKFEDERLQLEKEEAKEKFAYEQAQQGLSDNIEQGETELATKTQDMQKTKKRKAADEEELETTQKALVEDSAYLQDTENLCLEKAQAYENRQVTRAGEIEAIEQALGILNSDDVKGNAEKHLPSLTQRGVALVQLRGESRGEAATRKAVELLQSAAQRTGSRTLEMLAIQASGDPFQKVKKMIADMITKLMNEANEEATHKGFCDTELAMNKNTRDEKSTNVEKLTAEVEERTSKSDDFKEKLAKLTSDVSELDKAVAEATETRNTEHAKNTETIADAKAGQKAVASALEVLKNFYAKNAANTDLMQGPADDAPATFDEPEQGQQGAATGVIGMLEVVLSDFTRLETETTEDESEAQSEYDTFVNESKEDKAVKQLDIETYTADLQRNEGKLHDAQTSLEDEQAELDTAEKYFEELKEECVTQPVSYEERVRQREEEIASLQNALQVLGGDSNILDSQGA
mmetsp:Transcript_21621/g.52733  ORF Transcript_21621/g.52733 Transcript_21621/m.52733 type:complete len:662 (-) Transcript_21621:51-2036(-)